MRRLARISLNAVRIQTKPKRKRIYMHREIMKPAEGEQIDHINLNGLNNKRCNLRTCTNSQNHQNSSLRGGTSCYRGVSWSKRAKKWQVVIKYQGKSMAIGYFDDEKIAAKAYDRKAQELFGEFARANNV